MANAGYITIGTDGNGLSANKYAYANPFTLPGGASGDVSTFSLYGEVNAAGGIELRLGLYSDNSGTPGNLLDYTALITPTNQTSAWITEDAVLGYTLAASTTYWIAVFDTNAHIGTQWRYYYDINGVNRKHINMGDVNQFADPWAGTSPGTSDQQWSLYLTYGGGGGTNPGGDINPYKTRIRS